MTPRQLLGLAEDVSAGAYTALGHTTTRAVAMVARRALEDAVERALGIPEEGRVPFSVQLLALETRCSTTVARRAALAWAALSRMCHYHGYELSPTHGELRGWLEDVASVVAELERPPSTE